MIFPASNSDECVHILHFESRVNSIESCHTQIAAVKLLRFFTVEIGFSSLYAGSYDEDDKLRTLIISIDKIASRSTLDESHSHVRHESSTLDPFSFKLQIGYFHTFGALMYVALEPDNRCPYQRVDFKILTLSASLSIL